MKNQVGNILIGFVILAVLAAGVVLYYYNSKQPGSPGNNTSYSTKSLPPESTQVAEQTKTFQSEKLRFSIEVSPDFNIDEKFTTVILTNGGFEIKISRVATNFEDLDNYLKDLSTKNKFNLSNKKNLTIHNSYAVEGTIENEKIYFIYVDGWVFSLSTSSEVLYDDLDQIAQTFKYTP